MGIIYYNYNEEPSEIAPVLPEQTSEQPRKRRRSLPAKLFSASGAASFLDCEPSPLIYGLGPLPFGLGLGL